MNRINQRFDEIYINLKELLLLFIAMLLALFLNSSFVFFVAVILLSVIAFIELYQIIWYEKNVSLASVLAVSIILGYGFGSFVFLLSCKNFNATDYQYFAPQGLFYTQENLSIALLITSLAVAVLFWFSRYEGKKQLNGSVVDAASIDEVQFIIWFSFILTGIALLNGDLGYMGSVVDNNAHVTVIGSLAVLVVPVVAPLTVLRIHSLRNSNCRILYLILLLFFVFVLVVIGRRYLLYSLLLSLVMFFSGSNASRESIKWKSVLGVLAVGFVLFYGFKLFFVLRLAAYVLGRNPNVLEHVHFAFENWESFQNPGINEQFYQNIGSRPFILSYFAGLIGRQTSDLPGLGVDLYYSVMMSIPSLFMPLKNVVFPHSSEEMMHPLYNIMVFDGPNSVLVSGFNDFGIIGAIFYPLFVVLLFGFYYKLILRWVPNTSIHIFVILALLFNLLYIEQSLAAVFVLIRDLTILVVLFRLLFFSFFSQSIRK